MTAAVAARPGVEPGPLRILYVIPGGPDGNNMVFARSAAAALRLRGHEVDEFYLASRTNPVRVARETRRLRRHLHTLRPSVVHAQYGSVTGLVCALAAGDIPMVMTIRGSDLNRVPSVGHLRNRLTHLMTQTAALRAEAVVCVSDGLRRQLWRRDGRVRVIPTGVDTDLFRPGDAADARRALHIPPEIPVILFNAGLSPALKGASLVEGAMQRVRIRHPQAQLMVMRGDLDRRQVALLMNAASCLVLASESEGSPNVVKEAMASNLPVVATAVGDVATRLADVTPGAIVDRTPAALAEGVMAVLAAGRRSNGADELSRQGLSQQQALAALLDVYASLAAMRPAPASIP